MANRARRYDGEQKLNIKKIIAVIVFIVVIVMFVIGIKSLLNGNITGTSGKIEATSYFTMYDNGKWGVINSKGEIVIKPTYDSMIVIPDSSKDIFICVYDINNQDATYKTKVINSKEKEIIKDYEKVEAISNLDKNQNIWYENNVFKIQKNGKYGLADFSGKEILNPEYEEIEPIEGIENSLLIKKDEKYGLCDTSGNIIIDAKYKKIEKIEENYKNGYIVVDENDKYGIIGFDKSIILECNFEEIAPVYSNNLFVVKKNGKYIVIDKEGQTVVENKFDEVKGIAEEYIIAKKNEKYGVINTAGETKIKFEYDNITYMNTNYFIALKNEKYGVISIDGEEKVPFEYIDISYVKSGDFIIADHMENRKIHIKSVRCEF
ncbi:MAG: WG repeat-containing protein [Clostridia bacterium]|nr:WG repeat-containing protein [Clostridia bacterium]